MPIAAVAIVGAVVAGAALGNSAGSDINEQRAQAIQKQAKNDALDEANQGFDFTQETLQPFIDVGTDALETLDQEFDELTSPFTTADFEADPGFQFRIEQGEKAINNFLASRGLSDSGRAGKELTRFNQGEATNEFDRAFNRFQTTQGNRFNRLMTLANVGQENVNTLVNANTNRTNTNVNTILGQENDIADRQSVIGGIQNDARETRGKALAGTAKSISSTVAGGMGGGPGGIS